MGTESETLAPTTHDWSFFYIKMKNKEQSLVVESQSVTATHKED